MKIFTIIFTIIAAGLIIFNSTQVDFSNPFEGQSVVALITVFASLCAIALLQVLRLSKKSKPTTGKQKIMFDALIIGGGAAGMSCALVLGSAQNKAFAKNKRIGIVMHQKASHLQNALFNNVLGLQPGTTGATILKEGKEQLSTQYPHITQIDNEKVCEIIKTQTGFTILTNKETYTTKCAIIAVGYTNLIAIKGLESYIEAHPRTVKGKDRVWLKNTDHKIEDGLYVAGSLAGWRSQFAIASGSGAHVATDILTLWNNGIQTKIHDKLTN